MTTTSTMPVLTVSQSREADALYAARIAEFEAKREAEGRPSSPMDYYTYKAIWASTHGADAVQIIADPQ